MLKLNLCWASNLRPVRQKVFEYSILPERSHEKCLDSLQSVQLQSAFLELVQMLITLKHEYTKSC
jgi:hypothetical protein